MGDEQSPSEEELIRRFRSGDAEALCTLFRRHEPVLRARVGRILPPSVQRRVAVSDVLQESRVVALDRCGDFEPRGPAAFRNWVVGIAENKARRAVQRHGAVAMRSVRREVTQAQRVETAQLPGDDPSPSQVAVASELAQLARQAMATLPPHYREVLRLTRERGLTLRQAAERMGMRREATKKLYGRALTRLAQALRELRGESLA